MFFIATFISINHIEKIAEAATLTLIENWLYFNSVQYKVVFINLSMKAYINEIHSQRLLAFNSLNLSILSQAAKLFPWIFLL